MVKIEALRRVSAHFSDKIPCYFVTAPSSGNPNLRAQQGIFTLWRPYKVVSDHLPLDETIEGFLTTQDHPYDRPMFVRFTLPLTEARGVLRELAKEGVTAAKLFPGYQGVVKTMHEESIWTVSD